MKLYYETVHMETGAEFPTVTAHDTLDAAIAFADANGIAFISEIGGTWAEFGKCEFCGGWFGSCELNDDGACYTCEIAVKSHGG